MVKLLRVGDTISARLNCFNVLQVSHVVVSSLICREILMVHVEI